MQLPLVAIIGRANVGKSTLFNRITHSKSAIVNDTPGVTRDRIIGSAEYDGKHFLLMDTAGIDILGDTELELKVLEQAQVALESAHTIVYVADSHQGLTPQDEEIVDRIRKSQKPFFFAVNKVDHERHESHSLEFTRLGFEKVYSISAEHDLGVSDLLEDVAGQLPETPEETETGDGIKVAVVGRPNAGKSSLINNLLKSNRCIVSSIPGTTRDAVDSTLIFEGKKFILVDTAGIRRKGKTKKLLDKFSVIMALKAMERCDIAVLVLDVESGVTEQDANIAGYAIDRGRGCVIVLNKWDLAKDLGRSYEQCLEEIRNKLKFLDFAPVVRLSAKTGQNVHKLLPHVEEVFKEFSREIPTSQINECFEKAIRKNPMSQYRGKFVKLFYSTQVKSRPPTFRCFVNYPKGIHFSYQRYLLNSLRKKFGLGGTPLRLIFSTRSSR